MGLTIPSSFALCATNRACRWVAALHLRIEEESPIIERGAELMKRAAATCLMFSLSCGFAPGQAYAQFKPFAPPEQSSSISIVVLTDTLGVDFKLYLKSLYGGVRTQWYQLIPTSVSNKKGRVVLEFAILRDGRVAGLRLAKSSGDVALDRPALGSITGSNPFALLPSEFRGPYLGLRLTYLYNLQPFAISPRSVKVAAGEAQQFRTTKVGSQETVEWSLEGCARRPCGSISATGLYTAPKDLPDPPEVKVIAVVHSHLPGNSTAPLADMGEDTATITIVKPEKPGPPSAPQ